MKKLIVVLGIGLLASISTFADIARPNNSQNNVAKPKAAFETTLNVRLRADEKEARLIIPRSQIKQLRAQLDAMDDGTDTAAGVSSSGFAGTQTVMSGLFLSMAIAFAGVWLMRSRSTNANKGIVAAIVLSCITSASFVYANAGPPPSVRNISGPMFSQTMQVYGFGYGKIKVETTDDENDLITLIVPNPKTSPSPGEE